MEIWLSLMRGNIKDLGHEMQEMIYLSFRQLVYRDIFFLLRDHNLAEDVVQESFMKVHTNASKLKHTTNIEGWIKTVARNTAYDMLKKNKKYRHISELDFVNNMNDVFHVIQDETSVANEVENSMRDELLYQALDRLKPNHRQVLLLFYIEEKSYKEIAQELNVTEQALAQLLVRARKRFFQEFSGKWSDQDES